MDRHGIAFWPFSLALYQRPGVADACLRLQDEAGADVNLLLFCAWRAEIGLIDWAAGELQRAEAALAPVRAVLLPYRQARRALKALAASEPAAAGLYDKVKATELRLEEIAQAYLTPLAQFSPALRRALPLDAAEIAAAAERHLAAYAATLAQPDHPAIAELLAAIS
nr:TIGR02444 family protein [Ferrovibrio sp.]